LPSNLDIDIGDYNNQLEAWNSQNMLDYQLVVRFRNGSGKREYAEIHVKNGIPVSSNPPERIAEGRGLKTVLEFYSYIKEREKAMRDWHKETTDRYSLKVRYDTTYHYPCEIVSSISYTSQLGQTVDNTSTWTISVRPFAWETETRNGEE
jgi:hypothetical protein